MPQPKFLTNAGGKQIALIGGGALPNGQGTMTQLDLNDMIRSFIVTWQSDDANRQMGLEQLLYRSRGVFTSDDFGPRDITVPMQYIEDSTHVVGGLLAALESCGEQPLTHDNLTYITCKYAGLASRLRQVRVSEGVWAWQFNMLLKAANSYFLDAGATAGLAPLTLTADTGQAFTITYAGSIWCEPVWTLVVPVGNGVAINSMQIKSTMWGANDPRNEVLTVNFQSVAAIPAATARTITIDCGAQTIVDDLGRNYDMTGTFPMLYPAVTHPPVGMVNPFSVIIVPASGASAGLTLAESHVPRWRI
jgi:hypothetical protein